MHFYWFWVASQFYTKRDIQKVGLVLFTSDVNCLLGLEQKNKSFSGIDNHYAERPNKFTLLFFGTLFLVSIQTQNKDSTLVCQQN